MRPIRSLRTAALPFALVATTLVVACSDEKPGMTLPPDATIDASRAVALMTCNVSVATLDVDCDDTPTGLFSTNRRFGSVTRVIGGQGTYVRLASSNVNYAANVFSFDATVQNLSDMAMATSDGATRHDSGIQVFFSANPTATGGSGVITINNATGTGTFTGANQSYYQYGGKIASVDQTELGGDGILSATNEISSAKNWQFGVPGTVTSFSFTVYVSTEMPSAAALNSTAPQVTSVTPATLTPGSAAVINGSNFNATPGNNTVTIGGRTATVTGGTGTTQLNVTVPCTNTGTVAVQVTQNSLKGNAFDHPLQVTALPTLSIGNMTVVTSASTVACSEIPTNGGGTREYWVAVYNTATDVTQSTDFKLEADTRGGAPVAASARSSVRNTLQTPATRNLPDFTQLARDQKHYEILEKNREAYNQLAARFGTGNRANIIRGPGRANVTAPPATKTFRVPNLNSGNICTNYFSVPATRVYYNGKVAIYEDDNTPAAFKTPNATMQALYDKIGDQYNNDMEPIIRNNFGDPLVRDANTDDNGVIIALFTPVINNNFSGVAGFVVSCDQFANDEGTTNFNTSSNFGEVFYAMQPTVNGTGYVSGNTPDQWYRTIRSTFIHEVKHSAAFSARVVNGAGSFESSWLEEGLARHSEEKWARDAVDPSLTWKNNNVYGTFGNPVSVYCDVRPGFAECDANTRRPAQIMFRHFDALYAHMFSVNGVLLSPFGRTAADGASYFYAISWSLIRYTIDRYASTEAAFYTALTQATTTSTTNLLAAAGNPTLDQVMAGWSLALAVDDDATFGGNVPSNDVKIQTWNLRNIYSGLKTDFNSTYPLAYPLTGQANTFGTTFSVNVGTMYSGGVMWFHYTGTQNSPQLVRLTASNGSTVNSNVHLAVVRVQ